MDKKYLELLARNYPTIESAISEVINLKAIMCLPKGTEYFFSDLHGENEAFLYLLKSASGVIQTKIENLFGQTISKKERAFLGDLIYEPEKYLKQLKLECESLEDFYEITIYRLIQVCKCVSSKYTRSKVRKKMPAEYAYILDELLHADQDIDKEYYYQEIISSIVKIGNADNFIKALCLLIQKLCIDCLHIIGDIYDRGPRPDIIMNELTAFNDVDIQWGNHDISWMGAGCGNLALIANVIRLAIHYNNFDLIEDGYGISLRSLAVFASEVYNDDPCERLIPNVWDENKYSTITLTLAAKMHKAIAVIQFKLEAQLLEKHSEYNMDSRSLLKAIDFKKGTVIIDGVEYHLSDTLFPTVDPLNPSTLTKEETELMRNLRNGFLHSEILHKHIRYLYARGSMYKCVNDNLLYHGCIPMKNGGKFESIEINGQKFKGKSLLDYLNEIAKTAYFAQYNSEEQKNASDFMWYLWCGEKSPLFGKSKLACFEGYFIDDKKACKEIFNPYFTSSQNEDVCNHILKEFQLNPHKGHIINGHVPVRIIEGESPIKADGKLFIIDGGISKAYRSKTGIAGYTLIYNSRSLNLAKHLPEYEIIDEQTNKPLKKRDAPVVSIVELMNPRVTVAMTDIGEDIAKQAEDIEQLICAYQSGLIKENPNLLKK